jgi:hypothetical protein
MASQGTLTDTLVTAAVATAVTTATTMLLGRAQLDSAAAPLNATSHIAWGDEAAEHDELDLKHTLVGGVINALAMVSWAFVEHALFPKTKTKLAAAATGAAVSALAYVTDYYVVPKRLTPGFEMRLSPRGLLTVYAGLAAALATGAALAQRD